MKVEFKLNDPEFALTGTENFKYEITSFQLFTRQVSVIASSTMEIFKRQSLKPLIMSYTSVEVQSYTASAGKQVEYIRAIFPHQMPHQLFMVLVETDCINGDMSKVPFKFENGQVEQVVLRQNGIPVMVDALITDFQHNKAMDPYFHTCQAFNVGLNGRDVNLTLDQFIKGSTIWAWTLSPDMDADNGVGQVQKPGNFEADIYVRSGYSGNKDLMVLFFGKFRKSVFIGNGNTITLQ